MFKLHRDKQSKRWHVFFIDRHGARFRQTTGQIDKRAATVRASELYRRHADPTYHAPNETTVQAAADNLVKALVNEGKPESTRRFYRGKLGHVLRVLGKDSPLSSIEAKTIDAYIDTRAAEGAKPTTISKELVTIRRMLKHARRRNEFDKEISQVMPVNYAAQYEPRERWIDRDTAWTLIREVPVEVGRYIAWTLATSGRDAAARRAVGADFSAARRRIQVRDKKTAKGWREVPVNKITAPFAEHAFVGLKPKGLVFPGSYTGARHAIQRACKRLGIPNVTSNDLRRSLAHWFRDAGIPRDVAGEFFAHVDERMMAKVYGKLSADELEARMDRILDESWTTQADSAESAVLADTGNPKDAACFSGTSAASNRLCNPLPNHLATSPRCAEHNEESPRALEQPAAVLDESWTDSSDRVVARENKPSPAARYFQAMSWGWLTRRAS